MTDNAAIENITEQSAQSRAHDNTGISGAYLPQPFLLPFFRPKSSLDIPRWGFAGRDALLARVWKQMGAELVACAVAVLSQKLLSTDYLIDGPMRTVNSRCKPLLDTAELGAGYLTFLCKFVDAFTCFDNGVFVELIGTAPALEYANGTDQRFIDGEAVPDLSAPRDGPIAGIAVLDSLRCARTRDLEFPVRYYDLQGRTHLLHRSRVWFTSDMPSTEESMYNYGYCALSRCLSTLHYGVNWTTARNEMLDSMPPLQYLTVNGINKEEFKKQAMEYQAQRQQTGEYILRSVMMLVSPNSDKPITFQSENIRQLWDSFDERSAFDTCVDQVAMAFGLDHQDLAPLNTSAMGSGAQSTVLDEKTLGKGPGYLRTILEQFFRAVFPKSCRFEYDYQDDKQDLQRITIVNGKVDAVLKLFNAKQGASPASTGMPFFSKAAAAPTTDQIAAPMQTPDPASGAPVDPPAEFLIDREQAMRLLISEVPDWADILDPGGSLTEDITVDELTPDLQQKSTDLYGPRVRYHSKSRKTVLLKAKRNIKAVSNAEIASAMTQIAAMGIDLATVREYGHTKALDTDEQRRWFFAHNPEYAAQGNMPHFDASGDSETHRIQLEKFVEGSKSRVANHLWDRGLIKYDNQARVVVDHDRTREAAKTMVTDTRDAQYPRSYIVGAAREQYGVSTARDSIIEGHINGEKASEAQAILMAAHVGNVRLTDAQTSYLHSVAHGNYLDEKYSQYTSGDRGTLQGVKHEPTGHRSSDGYVSAASADLNAMRYEFANRRSRSESDTDAH